MAKQSAPIMGVNIAPISENAAGDAHTSETLTAQQDLVQRTSQDNELASPQEIAKGSDGLKGIAFIGDYLPRRCGIATFTSDLCEAVSSQASGVNCFVVAMNDSPEGYEYPARVRFDLNAANRGQYDLAADFLNANQVDVVCVQHEFGIYGGQAGRYILPLLRQLRSPIVTTLHTILVEPSPDQKWVLTELAKLSDFMVVMNERAIGYLREIYQVPETKIRFIHHGIPDVPFIDPNFFKDKFDAEGRLVMLTFGLLTPSKGIEYGIQALGKVVKTYPNLLYIVLGATHPHVRREHGEEYRIKLQQLARVHGLNEHVRFHDRFVELNELCEYLGAADIYLTPYTNPDQIVSGTLAYALGTGKAVISTPYWYAEDMLADGRGVLVPFRDAEAIATALTDLLAGEANRHAMRKRGYELGRSMIWKEVAKEYLSVFEAARESRKVRPHSIGGKKTFITRSESLPDLNPRHLLTLTDSVGILQHSRFSIPDPSQGYSADDQARALVVAVKGAKLCPGVADWDALISRYLSFLLYAFNSETSKFRNFMNYRREWTDAPATDDVQARAIWALAHVVAYSEYEGHRSIAMQLLDQAIPVAPSSSSPRAWAITILGIQRYLERYGGASAFRRERQELATRLHEQFKQNATADWPWAEDRLTYANARLPQALLEAGQALSDSEMAECGLRALEWLDDLQKSDDDHFVPIGNNGWYVRGQTRARFDQQPIEAYCLLDACLSAYRVSTDRRWVSAARRAYDWFLGRNDLQLSLYDYVSGGCQDGLRSDRVNQNQGAESTLVWLLSLLAMYELQEELKLSDYVVAMGEEEASA